MSVALLAIGVSHKTAPVALRERLALPEGRAAGALRELVSDASIHEAVAISTCNRTELHLVAGDPVEAENSALTALSRQAGIRPTELLGRIYSMRGAEAARHLFSVAVDLARATLGELETRRVLVLGAGENGELTARALSERGVTTVFIANRRYDRAIGLAQRFGGEAVRFDDLPEELVAADIVVSSTGSPHQILGQEELALVAEQRQRRPLLLIDIAVPRDIDPSVRTLPGLILYDMDDLQRESARNLSVHEAEATRARLIVGEELERFEGWLAGLDVVPTIAALRERGEAIVTGVLGENEPRFDSLSEPDRQRLHAMARSIVGRLLHEPTVRLKRSAGGAPSYVYVQALRELFGLDQDMGRERLRRIEARMDGGDAGDGEAAPVTQIESRRSGATPGSARPRDASDRRGP